MTISGNCSATGWVGGANDTDAWAFPGLGTYKGIKVFSAANTNPGYEPSSYSVGLQVSGYYSMTLASYGGDNVFWIRSNDSAWKELIHSGNISSQSVNYATSAGEADTVDGHHFSEFTHKASYNLANGYLVKTSIGTDSYRVFAKIEGQSYNYGLMKVALSCYTNQTPDTNVAFAYPKLASYNYYAPGDVKAFYYEGHLCFWFSQPRSACSMNVWVTVNSSSTNYVSSITNSTMPTSGVTCLTAFTVSEQSITSLSITSLSNYYWPLETETYPYLRPGGNNNWIKIGSSNSSYGLLPSCTGNAGNGHNYLGTSSWYWKYAYIDLIYCENAYSSSDRHIKSHIKNIDRRSLSDLFDISDKLLKSFILKQSGKPSYGFIAQELEKYIPEAVQEDKESIKSVSYDIAYAKLFAALIYKIKELEKKVNSSNH